MKGDTLCAVWDEISGVHLPPERGGVGKMGVILPAFETLRGGVPTRRTPPRSGGEFSSLRGGVRVGDFSGVLKTPPRSGGEYGWESDQS